jgi:hypothetical protein
MCPFTARRIPCNLLPANTPSPQHTLNPTLSIPVVEELLAGASARLGGLASRLPK